jgi:hypothetical protein
MQKDLIESAVSLASGKVAAAASVGTMAAGAVAKPVFVQFVNGEMFAAALVILGLIATISVVVVNVYGAIFRHGRVKNDRLDREIKSIQLENEKKQKMILDSEMKDKNIEASDE